MISQSCNPLLPNYEYLPDVEPYIFGNRLYLYGSHDRFGGTNFCQNNYVAWSAAIENLSNWHMEGTIYVKKNDPLVKRDSMNLFAPDVTKGLDGKYYLFYSLGYEGVISVAVSDTPAGHFHFYGHVRYADEVLLGRRKGDPFMFDPSIFIDDDSKVYLYVGFSPKTITKWYLMGKGKLDGGYVIELESDMLTVKSSPRKLLPGKNTSIGTTFEGHGFFEASSVRKYGNLYYYIYSSELNHELCHAISTSPTGPFIYAGTIISNSDIGFRGRKPSEALNYYGNNHGGMVNIKGHYYIFYHRQTNRHEYSRQVCAEEIHLNDHGTFDQVEMTSLGLNQGPLIGKGSYSCHIACNLVGSHGAGSYSPLLLFSSFRRHPYFTQSGNDRESDPDQFIANFRSGSVAGFKYFQFEGLREIIIKLDGKAFGELLVFIDLNQEPIGRTSIDFRGQVIEVSIKTQRITGTYPLYFQYQGKGFIDLISFELI